MSSVIDVPVPRILPVAEPTAEQLEAISKAPRRADGTVRNLFLTLAHHPKLNRRFNAFAGTFFRYGVLSGAERELLVLRVATRTHCAYELAQHIEIAREEGLDSATILAALDQEGAGKLSEHQLLLMRATDQILATGAVDEQVWQELAAVYDDGQLIELVAIIGFYRFAADLMNVVGIAVEGPIDLPVDWMPDALIKGV